MTKLRIYGDAPYLHKICDITPERDDVSKRDDAVNYLLSVNFTHFGSVSIYYYSVLRRAAMLQKAS